MWLCRQNPTTVRCGALKIQGDPEYLGGDDTPAISQGMVTLNIPLVVDGFGRHNECSDADTADVGTQVCNIQGEYGYFGGYDNDYGNASIEYVNVNGDANLTLNALGRGSVLQHFNLISTGSFGSHEKYMLEINGGAVNIRDFYYAAENYHGALKWSYGYVGSIQSAYLTSLYALPNNENGIAAFIKGVNNPEEVDALPRSAPVLANISINYSSFSSGAQQTGISLYDGSAVNLYNSVIGSNLDTYYISTLDQCIYIDDSDGLLTSENINIINMAAGCAEFSNDSRIDEIPVFTGNAVFNWNYFQLSNAYNNIREAVSGFYEMEPLLKNRQASGFSAEFPYREVAVQGNLVGTNSGDYRDSDTADTEFLEQTDYLGIFDYNQHSEIVNYLE